MITTINSNTDKRIENYSKELITDIDYHKKTAACLVTAARHYLQAARYEESGDRKRAYESTIQAEGILLLALTFREKNNFL